MSLSYVFYTGLSILAANIAICNPDNNLCKHYKAQFDTGATTTVVDPQVIKDLNAKPFAKGEICGVGDNCYDVNYYNLNIFLKNKLFPRLQVAESIIQGDRDIKLLIGMDFIGLCDMYLDSDGKKVTVHLYYPAKKFSLVK